MVEKEPKPLNIRLKDIAICRVSDRAPVRTKQGENKEDVILCYKSINEPSNNGILRKKIDDLKEELRGQTDEVNQLCDLVKSLEQQN